MRQRKEENRTQKGKIKKRICTQKFLHKFPFFTFNFIIIFVCNDNDINEFYILSKVTWEVEGGGFK